MKITPYTTQNRTQAPQPNFKRHVIITMTRDNLKNVNTSDAMINKIALGQALLEFADSTKTFITRQAAKTSKQLIIGFHTPDRVTIKPDDIPAIKDHIQASLIVSKARTIGLTEDEIAPLQPKNKHLDEILTNLFANKSLDQLEETAGKATKQTPEAIGIHPQETSTLEEFDAAMEDFAEEPPAVIKPRKMGFLGKFFN